MSKEGMVKEEFVKDVYRLIQKASQADKSDDALKFSQAACNAANAMNVLKAMNSHPTD